MQLLAETYVVLDVPDPLAGRVLDLRRQARDDFRAALPVEVTLITTDRLPQLVLVERVRLR